MTTTEQQSVKANVSVRVTTDMQAKLFDEQKRLVIAGKVERVSDASTSRICTKVISWYLDQPDAIKDQILVS